MKKLILFGIAVMMAMPMVAQVKPSAAAPKQYVFTDVKINPATSVKDQASSGTCWSYSMLAFIESELLRNKKGEHDLSEMWIVRNTYINKVKKYLRMHGKSELAQGGAAWDCFDVIEEYGIVPEEVYRGLNYGTNKNIHGEVDGVIKAYMNVIVSNPDGKISTAWLAGINGILDAYFGPVPEKFTYQGKEYTPKSFAAELGIKAKDYVSVTSFSHKPVHTWFAIEVPDNFAWNVSYNATLDEMMNVIDNAIKKGQTIFWGSDVSEGGFRYNSGYAILPDSKVNDMSSSEKAKWTTLTPAEKAAAEASQSAGEINVTPEMRQMWYDNYQTTDDHGMQIVGVAKDQDGNKFYKVKNSWAKSGKHEGYFYVSEAFVKGKTMNIVVAREAVPFSLK